MQCPNDGATLSMSERSGVEVDYCPTCRGVWLDRGELDKILDRTRADEPPGDRPASGRPPPPPPPQGRDPRIEERHDRLRRQGSEEERRRKKRRSFLEDLFDFD